MCSFYLFWWLCCGLLWFIFGSIWETIFLPKYLNRQLCRVQVYGYAVVLWQFIAIAIWFATSCQLCLGFCSLLLYPIPHILPIQHFGLPRKISRVLIETIGWGTTVDCIRKSKSKQVTSEEDNVKTLVPCQKKCIDVWMCKLSRFKFHSKATLLSPFIGCCSLLFD